MRVSDPTLELKTEEIMIKDDAHDSVLKLKDVARKLQMPTTVTTNHDESTDKLLQ